MVKRQLTICLLILACICTMQILPTAALDFDEYEFDPDEFESAALVDPDGSTPHESLTAEEMQDLLDDQAALLAYILADLPAAATTSEISSFVADSSLGHLTFYLPAGTPAQPFLNTSNGYVINGTSGTLYLYCPTYPGYTFSASRFAGWTYRTNSGTGGSIQYDLNLRNVEGMSGAPSGSGVMELFPNVALFVISICAICTTVYNFRRLTV